MYCITVWFHLRNFTKHKENLQDLVPLNSKTINVLELVMGED